MNNKKYSQSLEEAVQSLLEATRYYGVRTPNQSSEFYTQTEQVKKVCLNCKKAYTHPFELEFMEKSNICFTCDKIQNEVFYEGSSTPTAQSEE
jgi:hypothetical protein